jgi:hypothetical protein
LRGLRSIVAAFDWRQRPHVARQAEEDGKTNIAARETWLPNRAIPDLA